MQIVLIDTFIAPDASKAAFLERTHDIQTFIQTLPGFVEGFVYERKTGVSRYNIITTAVWENEEALERPNQPWLRSTKDNISIRRNLCSRCTWKSNAGYMSASPISRSHALA